jgi:type III secretory pathway component EscU
MSSLVPALLLLLLQCLSSFQISSVEGTPLGFNQVTNSIKSINLKTKLKNIFSILSRFSLEGILNK